MIGTLAAVSLTAAASQWQTNGALRHALDTVELREAQIVRAVKWKGLTHAASQGSLATALTSEPELAKHFKERVAEIIKTISGIQKEILAHADTPQDKSALETVAQARKAVHAATEHIDQARKQGEFKQGQDIAHEELVPAITGYLQKLDDFVKLQEQQRDEAKADALAHSRQVAWLGWLVMGSVLALGTLGVTWLVRSIVRPLHEAVDAAQRIAAGDLTHRLHSDRGDEVGQLMRAMAEMSQRLHGVVTEVRLGVDSVSTASDEIAMGNQDLSSRTEQMATNLQQTASSMEELTGTVTQSADTARKANEMAAATAEAARRGGEAVSQVVVNMDRISESSSRIADIIGTIDGIAFQTNILALNAAVEAARAGEQGRGFAVVAGEVRSLAQRSAEAAKEIKTLITASVETVASGSALVAQTGSAMQDIVSSVQRVSTLIAEIAAASGEQRDGIAQVNQAVGTLDHVTQQNAALVEEAAAAAQSLRQQAQRLAQVVAVFDVGASARAAPAATSPLPATSALQSVLQPA